VKEPVSDKQKNIRNAEKLRKNQPKEAAPVEEVAPVEEPAAEVAPVESVAEEEPATEA
jgi:hypothetical protein